MDTLQIMLRDVSRIVLRINRNRRIAEKEANTLMCSVF